jgi:hypothetical protein
VFRRSHARIVHARARLGKPVVCLLRSLGSVFRAGVLQNSPENALDGRKNAEIGDFLENCDKKLDRKLQLLYLACPFPDNLSTTKEKSCVPYLYVKENRSIAL